MLDASYEKRHYGASCVITSAGVKHALRLIDLAIDTKEELNTSVLSAKVFEFLKILSKSKSINKHLNGIIAIQPPTIKGESDLLNFKCLDSNKNNEFHAIEIACGVNYKGYSTTMTRTVLIDPTPRIVENFHFLKMVFRKVLENLKSGISLHTIEEVARSFAQSENEELSKHLDIGFQLDIECKDKNMAMNTVLKAIAEDGMVLVISINLMGLKQAERSYDLKHSNTIIVKKDGLPVVLIPLEHCKQNFIIKSKN